MPRLAKLASAIKAASYLKEYYSASAAGDRYRRKASKHRRQIDKLMIEEEC